jgi:hypothetical protein
MDKDALQDTDISAAKAEMPVKARSPEVELLERIEGEPAYKNILYEILVFSREPRTTEEIEGMLNELTRGRTILQTPRTLISWLVGWQALLPVIEDNKPQKWLTSPAGEYAAGALAPTDRLSALLNSPDSPRLLILLKNLVEPKTRQELEDLLGNDKLFDEIGVYPSHFISLLEDAGGIEWNGKWRLTNIGREFLKTL